MHEMPRRRRLDDALPDVSDASADAEICAAIKAEPESDATADAGTNPRTGVVEDVAHMGGWGDICI